jgi:hypothetical protein
MTIWSAAWRRPLPSSTTTRTASSRSTASRCDSRSSWTGLLDIAQRAAHGRRVRPGADLKIRCEVERWRGERRTIQLSMHVPEEVPEGRYLLWAGGATSSTLRGARLPGRFRPAFELDEAWGPVSRSGGSRIKLYCDVAGPAPEVHSSAVAIIPGAFRPPRWRCSRAASRAEEATRVGEVMAVLDEQTGEARRSGERRSASSDFTVGSAGALIQARKSPCSERCGRWMMGAGLLSRRAPAAAVETAAHWIRPPPRRTYATADAMVLVVGGSVGCARRGVPASRASSAGRVFSR